MSFDGLQVRKVQRKTIVVLSAAQILSGLGAGSVVSVGSLLAVELSGSESWAGVMTTAMTLGAAFASIPLANFAKGLGRRAALTTGLLVAALGAGGVVFSAVFHLFWLLVVCGLLIGAGSAVNLQARFAATDLSEPQHRARDLSLVVWMSTIGAVAGPNLVGWGESLAIAWGLPGLSGLFIISTAGMLAGMVVLWFGMRPDPYLLSQRLATPAALGNPASPTEDLLLNTERGSVKNKVDADPVASPELAKRRVFEGMRDAVGAIGHSRPGLVGLVGVLTAHAVMVAVMSMTPVHLHHQGASVVIIGLTVSLHIAGMYALAPVMGLLADKFGGPRVVFGGLVVLLLAVVLAGMSGSNHGVTTIGLILLGLGWSAVTVAGSAMIAASVPEEMKVGVQGLTDSSMSLAGALGGVLAGVVLAQFGFAGLGLGAGVLTLGIMVWVVWVFFTPTHNAEDKKEASWQR